MNNSNKIDSTVDVVDVIKDISKLTTIPERSLNKLMSKMCWCICDAVEESTLKEQNITVIDIGIGQLCIQVISNEIQYKFIPDSKLEKYMVDTIVNKKNPIKSAFTPVCF